MSAELEVPALVDAPGGLRLSGSRCGQCGVVTFPRRQWCPRCACSLSPVALSRTGTLWTWTVQHLRPKSPPYLVANSEMDFEPFVVGYVELPDGVRVETRLEIDRRESIKIGMQVELVTDGESFAFAPVPARGSD